MSRFANICTCVDRFFVFVLTCDWLCWKQSIHIVVAGSKSGKFSQFMPGFGTGRPPMSSANLSASVTIPVFRSANRSITPTTPLPIAAGISEREAAVVLDPRAKTAKAAIQPTTRQFEGDVVVGLVDISKGNGDVFLDRIAELLAKRNTGKVGVSALADASLRVQFHKTSSCIFISM